MDYLKFKQERNLYHSAKGTTWKKHLYTAKKNVSGKIRYIYDSAHEGLHDVFYDTRSTKVGHALGSAFNSLERVLNTHKDMQLNNTPYGDLNYSGWKYDGATDEFTYMFTPDPYSGIKNKVTLSFGGKVMDVPMTKVDDFGREYVELTKAEVDKYEEAEKKQGWLYKLFRK